MDIQCKAMTGLLAAGVAVEGGPADPASATVTAQPDQPIYSTAGLFTPIPQTPALNVPPPRNGWPQPRFPQPSTTAESNPPGSEALDYYTSNSPEHPVVSPSFVLDCAG